MTAPQPFGVLLRRHRRTAGLTQEQLAERAGLSVQAISLLERGTRRFPRPETVSSLAEALDLPSSERELLVVSSSRRSGAQTDAALPSLPSAPAAFTGRQESLELICDYLLSGPAIRPAVPILAIDGMAGSGKTAVALKVAELISHEFPDGQIFVDLHGFTEGLPPADSGAVLTSTLRSLGVAEQRIPEDVSQRAALYRTVLAGKRLLLILDNAVSAAQVEPLFPGTTGCAVLITSRSKLVALASAKTMSLDPLQSDEAIDLFSTISDATGSPAQLTEVAELCGRLPLALQIVGARYREAATWTLRDLIDALTDAGSDQPGIAASFELSYRRLSDEHREVFRLMSLNPGPSMDDAAVASVTARPLREVHRILDDLLDGHLITEDQPGRYRFHDLLRSYAARCSAAEDGAPTRQAATNRLVDHYCATAGRAMDLLYPHEVNRRPPAQGATEFPAGLSDSAAAESWLDLETDTLLTIAETDGSDVAVYLSGMLHRHLQTRGRFKDAQRLHTRALEQTRLSGDRSSQVLALNNLALIDQIGGELEVAREGYLSALEIAKDEQYVVAEVMAELGLGEVDRMGGASAQAVTHYLRAQTLANQAGDPSSELRAFVGLGDVQWLLGSYDEAMVSYQRCLDISIGIDDRLGEINARVGLGDIHSDRDQPDQAIAQYEQALESARILGHTTAISYAVGSLANVLAEVGRLTEAAAGHAESLEIARRTGDRIDEANGLMGLGEIYTASGDYAEARRRLDAGYRLASDIGHPMVQLRALRSSGENFHAEGNFSAARKAFESAIELAQEVDQPSDLARAHYGVARAQIELDQLPQAIESLNQAAAVFSTFNPAKADQMLELITELSG